MVVINDILDFSKMEQERVVLEEQPFNLHSCIEESIDLVSACATEKRLNLAITLTEPFPKTSSVTLTGCARFWSICWAMP